MWVDVSILMMMWGALRELREYMSYVMHNNQTSYMYSNLLNI